MFFSKTTGGFYDENIHGRRILKTLNPDWQGPGDEAVPEFLETINPDTKIPLDAVEISGGQYASIQNAQAQGKIIQSDDFGCPLIVDRPPEPLNESKNLACRNIDQQAEETRQRFITPGSGQAMVYQRKAQEAETMELDTDPAPVNYPLLAAETSITGSTLQEVAESVLAQRDAWLEVAAGIETIRLTAKSAVKNADDAIQISQIISALNWPEPEESN